jgi:hypothetical protein
MREVLTCSSPISCGLKRQSEVVVVLGLAPIQLDRALKRGDGSRRVLQSRERTAQQSPGSYITRILRHSIGEGTRSFGKAPLLQP